MKSFPNIESKKFPGHNYYVGYGGGKVWHIYPTFAKVFKWRAVALNDFGYKIFSSLEEASEWLASLKIDPREPDNSREGIFRDHNCSYCQNGAKPCRKGNPNRCEYPHARND